MKPIYVILLALLMPGCLQKTRYGEPPPPQDVRFRLPDKEPPPIKPPPVSVPGFYAFDVTEDDAIKDANTFTSDAERNDLRYADGCDRFNSDEELAEFKVGFDKALNSLSTRNDVVKSVAIGSAKCLFRYQLSDYGISISEYRKLEDRTVLQIPRIGCTLESIRLGYCNSQLTNISTRGLTLQQLTNTLRPILHADDLMLAAFEGDQLTSTGPDGNIQTEYACDTYCDILEQEIRQEDFLANEQVDIQQQFDDRDALMGGVNDSGVAYGSRLYIFLESRFGRFRYTEDTSLVEPDSINNAPFTLEAAAALRDGDQVRILRSDKIFAGVAREGIFDLPNGGQGYRAEDVATGLAASFVPGNVANSGRHASLGLDSVIRPSMCMDCHSEGPETVPEVLLAHILGNNFLSDEKTIGTDFMNKTQIQQYQARVRASHARFLEQVGADPKARDPANARLFNPFRGEMTVRRAAGKFRLTPDQYLDCLRGSIQSKQNLGSHLTGGTVSLNDFEVAYPVAIEECNLNEDS